MDDKKILIKGIEHEGIYYPQTHAEAVLGLDEYIPENGQPGKDGKTWRPSVTEDGLLSWTIDSSSDPILSVNIKGKDGNNGDPGANGYTYIPSVSAEGVLTWSKTQGNPVTDPSSVNIKGPKGEDGKDGTGISLKPSKEECTAVGDAYIATSTTETEIEGHIYIYNGSVFTDGGEIKGPKGDQGNDGDPGKAATIQVGRVTTVAAGLNAKVTNVGSNTDATFDFEIPKGADGTPGTPGTDGGVYVPNVTAEGVLTWQYSILHPNVSSSTNLKGPKGDTFTFSDLTPELKLELKGDPGKTYTPEELTQWAKDEGFLIKDNLESINNEITSLDGRIDSLEDTTTELVDKTFKIGGTNLLGVMLHGLFGPNISGRGDSRGELESLEIWPPFRGMPVMSPSYLPEFFTEKTFDRLSDGFIPGAGVYTLSFWASGNKTCVYFLHLGLIITFDDENFILKTNITKQKTEEGTVMGEGMFEATEQTELGDWKFYYITFKIPEFEWNTGDNWSIVVGSIDSKLDDDRYNETVKALIAGPKLEEGFIPTSYSDPIYDPLDRILYESDVKGTYATKSDISRLDGRIDSLGDIADSGLILGETSTTAFPGDRGKSLEEWKNSIDGLVVKKTDSIEATRLKTPVMLWGNEFDGSENIYESLDLDDQDINNVNTINFSSPSIYLSINDVKHIKSALDGVTKAADDSKVVKYINSSVGETIPDKFGCIHLAEGTGIAFDGDDGDSELSININPNYLATTKQAGLMSASDKQILSNLNDNAIIGVYGPETNAEYVKLALKQNNSEVVYATIPLVSLYLAGVMAASDKLDLMKVLGKLEDVEDKAAPLVDGKIPEQYLTNYNRELPTSFSNGVITYTISGKTESTKELVFTSKGEITLSSNDWENGVTKVCYVIGGNSSSSYTIKVSSLKLPILSDSAIDTLGINSSKAFKLSITKGWSHFYVTVEKFQASESFT